jgi:thiosulfate/3-mercaptopyruvate sulfurtransferase
MKTATETTKSTTPKQPHGNGVLVDAHWLAAHLNDQDVRVVEVDVSAAAYNDWHIDGAAFWNVYADLKDADYHTVDAAALERLVKRAGIGPATTVVFYGYAPTLGFWFMKLFGHRDVRILDCSRDAWRAGGHPWSTTPGEQQPSGYELPGEDSTVRADRVAVQEAITQAETTLVDVRTTAEYQGDCFWPSGGMDPGGRAGHVPSAVHQPLDGLYNDDGSFRTHEELRGVFSPDLLDGGHDLITYCTIGGRAATAWFVLTQLLGRDRVQVYDGSWAEWGRTPGTPVERPAATSPSDASDASITSGEAMTFMQIMEITTTHPDEIQALVDQWSAKTAGRRTAQRSTLAADRDRPNTYFSVVEFPSYEEAMANSSLPETGEFAANLARLCDSPPVFRNLDVQRVDTFA